MTKILPTLPNNKTLSDGPKAISTSTNRELIESKKMIIQVRYLLTWSFKFKVVFTKLL